MDDVVRCAAWTNIQANPGRISRPPQGLPAGSGHSPPHRSQRCGRYPSGDETMKIVVIGGSGLIGSKLVEQAAAGGHEVAGGVAQLGRQHHHRRRTGRGAGRRRGRRRRGELAVVRGQGGAGVLRDLRPQPARRGSGRRRGPSRGAVGRRHRPPARQRLLPRQGGAGEPDQGLRHSLHDPALDAVLRVRRRHHPVGDRRRRRSACRPP